METNPFDTNSSTRAVSLAGRTTRTLAAFAGLTLLIACGSKENDADENQQEAASHSGDCTGGRAGSGGAGGTGGAGGSNSLNCPAASESVDPTATIDDMEDQDSFILAANGRNGGWWTAGDDTPGASLVPEGTELTEGLVAPEPIPSGRCGSSFAMHVTGQGFLDWGALLGADLTWGTLASGDEGVIPYDASAHTGIEFWARIGDTSTNRVRFAVSDVNNEPAGGVCELDGGPGKECFDTFGMYLPQLDTTWRRYQVPFSGLRQRDFGFPANAAAVVALYTIQFNFDPGAIFDLWVDDVGFY